MEPLTGSFELPAIVEQSGAIGSPLSSPALMLRGCSWGSGIGTGYCCLRCPSCAGSARV